MSKPLSAHEVRGLLRKKYAAPEWALLEEVRNKTGYGGGKEERYADAVAMSLYPSRGLSVLGFEIKVSRGDWLRELKDPQKSVAIQSFCDHWWVVIGGPKIVELSEVPQNWGLMGFTNGRACIVKDAPKLEPKPLDRAFVASMMRRMNEYVTEQVTSSAAFTDAFERGRVAGVQDGPHALRQAKSDLDQLKKTVEDFEKLSGFNIQRWQYGGLIQVLKQVQEFMHALRPEHALDQAERTLESSLRYVQAMKLVQDMVDKGEVVIPPTGREDAARNSHSTGGA